MIIFVNFEQFKALIFASNLRHNGTLIKITKMVNIPDKANPINNPPSIATENSPINSLI